MTKGDTWRDSYECHPEFCLMTANILKIKK